jgi:putative inorganic carbon (HCO3(-)) transporter
LTGGSADSLASGLTRILSGTLSRPALGRQFTNGLWIAASIGIALLIMLLPLSQALLILAIPTFFLLVLIHPFCSIAFLLITSPLRNLIATESALRLPVDIGQGIFALSLLGYFIWCTARNRPLIRQYGTAYFFPLIIFIFATGLTAFNAVSVSGWLSEWLKWVVIYVLALLVLNLGHWQWLVALLALTGAAHALTGIYIFFGGSGALHLLINDRFFRAFGTFGQPNPFGGFMGLLAPIALLTGLGYCLRTFSKFIGERRMDLKSLLLTVYYFACGGLMIVALVMSWSRGAWLGFGVALMVSLILLPSRWYHSLAILVVLVVVGSILWTSGRLPATIVDRVQSATQELFAFDDVRGVDITPENYAVVERLAHWQAALNMSRANWWLGVGFGNFEAAYSTYRLLNWHEPLGHAHNYYLNVLAEAGIIGVAAFVTFWIWMIRVTFRLRRHPDFLVRVAAVGFIGTWVYLLVHSLTDNLFVNNLFLHLGVMIGVIAHLYQQLWRTETLKIK